MSGNFFVQHPAVTRYILKHEQEARMSYRPPNLPTVYANPIPIMYRAHDPIVHTDESPYCSDPFCGCHVLLDNLETFGRHIEQPLHDGLLTTDEAHRIYWNEQV